MYLYLVYQNRSDGVGAPVKIGITSNLRTRLAGIQTGSPVPLRFYEVWDIDGLVPRDVERLTHSMRKDKRLTGEWFNVSPEEARQFIELVFNAMASAATGDAELQEFGLLDRQTLRPKAGELVI